MGARFQCRSQPDGTTARRRGTMVPFVSAPLAWDEIDDVVPITPATVLERIARRGDLFAEVLTLRQRVG